MMLIIKFKIIFAFAIILLHHRVFVSNAKSQRSKFTSQQLQSSITTRTIPENYHFSYPVQVNILYKNNSQIQNKN